MTQVASRARSPHYTWGDHCDGWHLLDAPGLSVIHERMPPGTSEVRHVHRVAQQFFFVLSGSLEIEVDGSRVTLREREGLHVPPGAEHQVCNASDRDVEFLVISQPPSRGDRHDAG